MRVARAASLLAGSVLLAACGGAAPASPPAASPSSPAPAAASAKPSGAALASAKPSLAVSAKPSGGASAKPATSSPAAGSPKIGISYNVGLGGQLALWVAQDTGIFAKNGSNVDLQQMQATVATGALQSGQSQLALIGGSEAVNLEAEAGDMVVIGVMEPVYPYKLEAAKGINTPADLKGRKVSVGSGTGSAGTATRLVLQKLGLDVDKDVQAVRFNGGVPARLAAMQAGQIEAALITPPETVAIEGLGFHPLIDAATMGLSSANETILAKRSWVDANKAAVQLFANSTVQGIAELKKNRAAGIAALKKYQKIEDQDLLDVAYDFFATEEIPNVPDPKPELFTDVLKAAQATNAKVANVTIDKLVDESFMQAAASAAK